LAHWTAADAKRSGLKTRAYGPVRPMLKMSGFRRKPE